MLSKVVSFNIGTAVATTQVNVTGAGFTPQLALFTWSGRTESTDAVGVGTFRRGFGIATSSSFRYCISSLAESGQTNHNTNCTTRNDACIATLNTDNTVDGLADFVAFTSDGCTLVIDDQFVTNVRVHVLFVGGDFTNIGAVTFNSPGVTGNQAYTGMGFQPQALLLLSSFRTTSQFNTVGVGANLHIGATDGTRSCAMASAVADNSTLARRYCRAGDLFFAFAANTGLAQSATLVSLDADGFTLNYSSSGAGVGAVAIGFAGGNYFLDSFLTATNTSNFARTGYGFSPSSAMLVSHCNTENPQNSPQDDADCSIGFISDVTERGAMLTRAQRTTTPAVVGLGVEHDSAYGNIDTASAIEGLMDLVSRDATGWTYVMDDADPTQNRIFGLNFGPFQAGPTTQTIEVTIDAVLQAAPGATAMQPEALGLRSLQGVY